MGNVVERHTSSSDGSTRNCSELSNCSKQSSGSVFSPLNQNSSLSRKNSTINSKINNSPENLFSENINHMKEIDLTIKETGNETYIVSDNVSKPVEDRRIVNPLIYKDSTLKNENCK